MSFRISTSRSLKENDLRSQLETSIPTPVPTPAPGIEPIDNEEKGNDTLEEMFDFSEKKKGTSSGLQLKKHVVQTDMSKNAPHSGFAIQNQKRGMEDFL